MKHYPKDYIAECRARVGADLHAYRSQVGKTPTQEFEARFLNDFHGARLGTINGRVIAVLPSNASFLGDFTQVNGDFEAAFPLNIHSHPRSRRVSGEVNGGRYSLKITTVNGDIKIDNGPVPPAVPAAPAPPASPAPRT